MTAPADQLTDTKMPNGTTTNPNLTLTRLALTADPGDGTQSAMEVEPRGREVPEALCEHDVEWQQESEADGHLRGRRLA